MADCLYPFKWTPRLVEKIWGGRKLNSVLAKPLPPDVPIGESWELYDFPPGSVEKTQAWVSSTVSNGPLAGKTLHELLERFGSAIHGQVPLLPGGQFPILIKFLDARENLSVQVHPDEQYVRAHPEAHLKSEAWYVLQADDNAKLYKGLRPGADREQFAKAAKLGNVEDLVNAIPVKADQCYYLPSGTVHALGAGILVAEVQTPSDTTYRVFDFNRIDPGTGKPRQLHVEQALECINFGPEPQPQQRSHVGGLFTTVTRLVTCPYFNLEKVRFVEGVEEAVPYDQPVVWIMLDGHAQISVKGLSEPVDIRKGETVLLPAKMDQPVLKTLSDCVWLEVTFPVGGK